MAGSIRQLEIFAAGTHRASTGTVTVTEQDLDQIVEAFNALQGTNIVRPHLKLGHTDAQKWFGQQDGIPSLGWIERVTRVGKKLLADVSHVPDALLNLIKQGRYHNVSAEVLWGGKGIEHDGRKFSRVLSAVSLLGVEMPAVKDLSGLASALFTEEPNQLEGATSIEMEATVPEENGNKGLFTQEQVDALISSAINKAVDETKAEFTSEIDSLKAQVEVLTQRAETAETEVKTVKASSAQREAETLVDQAIKDGKLMPKQRDFALAFMAGGEEKLKFGDGEKSRAELFKEFLDNAGKVVQTGEQGSGDNKREEFATAAEEVDHKVRLKLKEDTQMSYGDALQAVLGDDESLRQRYAAGQA